MARIDEEASLIQFREIYFWHVWFSGVYDVLCAT